MMHDLRPATRRLATLVEGVDDTQLDARTPSRQPAFGPVVDAPEDALALDRLIAMTGRGPGWAS